MWEYARTANDQSWFAWPCEPKSVIRFRDCAAIAASSGWCSIINVESAQAVFVICCCWNDRILGRADAAIESKKGRNLHKSWAKDQAILPRFCASKSLRSGSDDADIAGRQGVKNQKRAANDHAKFDMLCALADRVGRAAAGIESIHGQCSNNSCDNAHDVLIR